MQTYLLLAGKTGGNTPNPEETSTLFEWSHKSHSYSFPPLNISLAGVGEQSRLPACQRSH